MGLFYGATGVGSIEGAVQGVALASCTAFAFVFIGAERTLLWNQVFPQGTEGGMVEVDFFQCGFGNIATEDGHPSAGYNIAKFVYGNEAPSCTAGIHSSLGVLKL